MIKYILNSIALILLSTPVFAQEGLRPLHANLNYIYKDLNVNLQNTKQNTTALRTQSTTTTLFIPFLDDFSYAPTSSYPDQNKWMDLSTYVNSGYPIRPPSIGVATFDGLNQYGYPYHPTILNNNINFSSDTLRSQYINLMLTATSQTLQPSDSVALSFYFQPRGNGDPPELNDSLIVDFWKPQLHEWVRVWDTTRNLGPNTYKGDTIFTRAFIWISDPDFLKDSFQFRFRNYSAGTGNFDHWNIDYVYLDKGRSMKGDTIYNDLTFAYVPTPFLRDYSAMPFEQYTANEMALSNIVKIKNNGIIPAVNMTYKYEIEDINGAPLYNYSGGAYNLPWFNTTGYSTYAAHTTPPINYSFPAMSSITDYKIRHVIFKSGNASDFVPANDTVLQAQNFINYYALDDGSAEAGYYVNAAQAKIAIKINVNVPDSFLAARIYFDPVGAVTTATNAAGFRICVWAQSPSGSPGALLFKDTIFHSAYYNAAPDHSFAELRLIRPKYLSSGVYYIGIQQLADVMTFGFDANTDHSATTYYDSGSGWVKSLLPGSVMIRPVFGSLHPVGIKQNSISDMDVTVYPNPASSELIVHTNGTGQLACTLFNAMGQQVAEESMQSNSHAINTSTLASGIYILVLKTKDGAVQQKKIIIQH